MKVRSVSKVFVLGAAGLGLAAASLSAAQGGECDQPAALYRCSEYQGVEADLCRNYLKALEKRCADGAVTPSPTAVPTPAAPTPGTAPEVPAAAPSPVAPAAPAPPAQEASRPAANVVEEVPAPEPAPARTIAAAPAPAPAPIAAARRSTKPVREETPAPEPEPVRAAEIPMPPAPPAKAVKKEVPAPLAPAPAPSRAPAEAPEDSAPSPVPAPVPTPPTAEKPAPSPPAAPAEPDEAKPRPPAPGPKPPAVRPAPALPVGRVTRAEGSYLLCNRGSAAGALVGQKVRILHEGREVGTGVVIGVRRDSSDVEVLSLTGVAAVRAGDRVEPVKPEERKR